MDGEICYLELAEIYFLLKIAFGSNVNHEKWFFAFSVIKTKPNFFPKLN